MFTSFFSRTNGLAGGGQPFRLSPRRTPPFSACQSRINFSGVSFLLQRLRSADYIGFTRGLLLGFLPPALNFFSASAGC